MVLMTWWYVVDMVRLMLGGNDLVRALVMVCLLFVLSSGLIFI